MYCVWQVVKSPTIISNNPVKKSKLLIEIIHIYTSQVGMVIKKKNNISQPKNLALQEKLETPLELHTFNVTKFL